MKRFLLGILITVMTLAILLGAGLLLSHKEKQELPAPTETLPPVTEQTLPPETLPEPTLPPETMVPEKASIDSVPLYYQTDYPHNKFGNGTIASSGCSITCLAMVATYLTDQEYTPPQMAYHFGNYGKTHVDRLQYGIEQMQLPYERVQEVQKVLEDLREGKVAIVMMDEESYFTTEQHFIVLAGINEAGKVVVNDPLRPNYERAITPVRDGYDNGFEDHYIMPGFCGGWVFDKEDMGSDPFLYDASMPEQKENRYEGYIFTEEDIYELACYVYAEARNEPPEAKQAVAEVVLNRAMSGDYPNTVHDVIHRTEFYRAASAMKNLNEPGMDQYVAVDAAMYGPYILPEDICFYSAWEKGKEPWGQLGSFTFYKNR